MKKLITLVFCLSAVLPMLATADPLTGYKVEIIAFEHITQAAWQSENWPDVTSPSNVSGARELIPKGAYTPPVAYQLLPKSLFSLSPEERALNRKRDYRVLMHVAWYQPFGGGASMHPIHLTTTVPPGSPSSSTLDGTVQLWLDRYFTIKTDITFCGPKSDAGDQKCFVMSQRRRMKSKELNYFDHPLFGLLVQITRTGPNKG